MEGLQFFSKIVVIFYNFDTRLSYIIKHMEFYRIISVLSARIYLNIKNRDAYPFC